MSGRGVRLTVLGEDREHERFARHVLIRLGYHRRELRFLTSPRGRGAGEQWVREQYPSQVRAHRRRAAHQRVGLVVVVDADTVTVAHRRQMLDSALAASEQKARLPSERIVQWIPKRHIETWVAYLLDRDANEEDDYKRSVDGGEFPAASTKFVFFCREESKRPECMLPSLVDAITVSRAAAGIIGV